MPWYFLTFDGSRVNGYGVKTSPSAFCFWQRDAEGITLSIDLRNGGEATALGDRELIACTVVTRMGLAGEQIWRAGQRVLQADVLKSTAAGGTYLWCERLELSHYGREHGDRRFSAMPICDCVARASG